MFRVVLCVCLLVVALSVRGEQSTQDPLRQALTTIGTKRLTDAERRLAGVANIALGEYGNAYFILKEIPEQKRDPFVRSLFYEIYNQLEMEQEASSELANLIAIARTGKQLTLPKVLFCRKIMGFGMFQPFLENRFAPGQTVLIYSEVDNFTRVKNSDSWDIDLKVGILIKTELGIPLYENSNFSLVHFSPQSPIRDLWLTSRLQIPSTVQGGKNYSLVITVTDISSSSVVSKEIPFTGAAE
jgi:hypothetical protein